MSIRAIITAATLTTKETNFLELASFIDAGMPVCHYDDTGIYKWPFPLNAQNFCVALANRCSENTDPVFTL